MRWTWNTKVVVVLSAWLVDVGIIVIVPVLLFVIDGFLLVIVG